METPQILLLGEGLELTDLEMGNGQLVLHITATSNGSLCPLCAQPATRMHSRYSRVIKDLPCAGQQVQLILHVRKFFCDTAHCVRKIFVERLPQLVAPWAQMTTRLCQTIQAIGLATCGRLGARLASRLGIATSWMTIVRRVMALPTQPAEQIQCLGIDDFSFLRGRTFGTVLVNLDTHQVVDLLPDRQAETATTWMQAHSEITHISRDRGSEYVSAASRGAPQAIQVADRFHVAKNLSEAVQELLARVLTELKAASQGTEVAPVVQAEGQLAVEEWRPTPGAHVKQTISTRRAEREARYQQVESLDKQGLTTREIACRMAISERTVRHWLHRGVAPDTRLRRKYASDARSLCALCAQALARRRTQRNTPLARNRGPRVSRITTDGLSLFENAENPRDGNYRTTVRQRRSRYLCVVQRRWMRSNANIWPLSAWRSVS
jgi:transposase